jgi:hypothetical protein
MHIQELYKTPDRFKAVTAAGKESDKDPYLDWQPRFYPGEFPKKPANSAARKSEEGQLYYKAQTKGQLAPHAADTSGDKKTPDAPESTAEPTKDKTISPNQIRKALNQLGNKGISAMAIGKAVDKAASDIYKSAGPLANQFKELDLPIINKIKKELMSVLAGDLSEAKLTYRFFNILDEIAINEK